MKTALVLGLAAGLLIAGAADAKGRHSAHRGSGGGGHHSSSSHAAMLGEPASSHGGKGAGDLGGNNWAGTYGSDFSGSGATGRSKRDPTGVGLTTTGAGAGSHHGRAKGYPLD